MSERYFHKKRKTLIAIVSSLEGGCDDVQLKWRELNGTSPFNHQRLPFIQSTMTSRAIRLSLNINWVTLFFLVMLVLSLCTFMVLSPPSPSREVLLLIHLNLLNFKTILVSLKARHWHGGEQKYLKTHHLDILRFLKVTRVFNIFLNPVRMKLKGCSG